MDDEAMAAVALNDPRFAVVVLGVLGPIALARWCCGTDLFLFDSRQI
jgi:hypothetical protein